MLLNRFGNKTKIAAKIIQEFPQHSTYIEPFFGAGGMFFNKPVAKHNFFNDRDSEVFNLFQVLKENPQEMEEKIASLIYSEDLWQHWKKNQEISPVWKAIRFLYLSNLGYLGKPETLRFGVETGIESLQKGVFKTLEFLQKYNSQMKFQNCDFRKVIQKISFRRDEKDKAFIYADPPYVGTKNNYFMTLPKKHPLRGQGGWTEDDLVDLINILINTGVKFAISEFYSEAVKSILQNVILSKSEGAGLNIISIGERQTVKNRNTEILITNYKKPNSLF